MHEMFRILPHIVGTHKRHEFNVLPQIEKAFKNLLKMVRIQTLQTNYFIAINEGSI